MSEFRKHVRKPLVSLRNVNERVVVAIAVCKRQLGTVRLRNAVVFHPSTYVRVSDLVTELQICVTVSVS